MKDSALPRIRCSEELRQAVEKAAAEENRTVSNWILNIIKKELEEKSMKKELVCIVKMEDKESGDMQKIYWDGEKLIDEAGTEIMDGQGVETQQEAVERAFSLWNTWDTFECIMKYEA